MEDNISIASRHHGPYFFQVQRLHASEIPVAGEQWWLGCVPLSVVCGLPRSAYLVTVDVGVDGLIQQSPSYDSMYKKIPEISGICLRGLGQCAQKLMTAEQSSVVIN